MKRGWMAISVTTFEALMGCIRDECLAISVEQPLLDDFQHCVDDVPGIRNYDITWYPALEIAILKKARGTHHFDDEKFYIHHYFLRETQHPAKAGFSLYLFPAFSAIMVKI